MKFSLRFCLALGVLLSSCDAQKSSENGSKIEEALPDVCAINPKAIVSDACTTYSTIDQLNSELRPALDSITRTTDFFAYYRLNLFNKECPFWNDAVSMCGNIACAVTTLEHEEDIPEIWRAVELSKLEGPKAVHPGKKLQAERAPERPLDGGLGDNVGESCVVEYDDECDDRDYCVPEDESATAKGDYVSLVDNPERFTGYAGEGPKMVWDAIYSENCFSRASFPASAGIGKSPFPDGLAANDLKSVLFTGSPDNSESSAGYEKEDECLEKRVFYRIISGMHASISAHICADYLNQSTGEWGPNVQCYLERLHSYPDRISNLYFNYALVLRAVEKLGPYLQTYTFCSGDARQDRETKRKVQALTSKVASYPPIFDESQMFVNGEGPSLKEDFRNRFRNVSRLMDCVGCDKCRLWGKVQTAGYGAAMKVLFEFGEPGTGMVVEQPSLKRTELVALFNTLARISSSLTAVEAFRDAVEAQENGSSEVLGGKHYHKSSSQQRKPHIQTSGQQNRKGFAEVEDDDEELDEIRRKMEEKAQTEDSFSALFGREFGVVLNAYKYVLTSYVKLPRALWHLFLFEVSRFWEFFLGLPVTPREWKYEWRAPNFNDEL